MALPHLEARVRIYQSEIPGVEEESRMAAGSLRAGKPLLAPQTTGPLGGVVSLGSENRSPEQQTTAHTCGIFGASLRGNRAAYTAFLRHCKIRNLRRDSLVINPGV